MKKLDRLSKLGIVAIIVVALLGGAGVWWWSKQPLEPAKADPPVTSAPAPSCEPGTDPCTPEVAAEQAELKKLRAEAEAAYRASFTERVRLSNEGGATEPSPQLLESADGDYLDAVMALLRDQKARGEIIRSKSVTNVRQATGAEQDRSGADPRLTLDVCEDNTQSSWTDPTGVEHQSTSFAGKVLVGQIGGRLKVSGADLAEVDSCAGW